jgi:hypothetical protein
LRDPGIGGQVADGAAEEVPVGPGHCCCLGHVIADLQGRDPVGGEVVMAAH